MTDAPARPSGRRPRRDGPRTAFLGALLGVAACSASAGGSPEPATRAAPPPPAGLEAAVFAGGCFWCVEAAFDPLEGVVEAVSGYTGGTVEAPSYHQVGTGRTGHVEAVRVVWDPARIDYDTLLAVFWHEVDPTRDDGQFCDRGPQYRAAIFVADDDQRARAERSRAEVAEVVRARTGLPVVTEIRPATTFWIAEADHQDYWRTHPERYRAYREGCGRDARLREIWGATAGGHGARPSPGDAG